MADLVPNPSSDDSNSRSQNQQNIEGNENQVIGEVIDGTAIHTVSGNVIYNYYYRKEIPIENTTESAETALLPCPYRGLSHFEPGDAKYFFGRESFVEELVEATQTRNFIALLGASGSGKSSVVFAGLVPKLQQAGHWQFTHFRPGSDPFHTLALALIPLYTKNLDETEQIRQSRNLAGYFRTGEVLLADVFAQIQQNFPNDRVLLIADQFEELYTLCKDETTSDFLSILLAGIDKTPFAPVLVATMRADFLGNALSSKHFADVLKNADLKLGPMNREELTEAISKPAKMARHPLDLSTINLLIEQTADRAGTLPLLQFALTQIWEGLAAGTTPAETLRLIGGVGGALARKAQDIYDKLTSDKKKIAQRVFLSLVQLGEGDKTTCRQVKIKNLVSKQNSLDLLQETIYLFASPDARLITLANDGDAETAEITHEALFDNWQQLKNWLEGSREYLWTRQRLDDAIETWERRNRPEGSLWQAQDLESLRNFYKHAGIDMTQRQIYFFNASKQSAKWKKVKDISPYCMFGALITLCFFWVTDVEYITAKIQNENTFFVKKPTSGKDKYYYDLLRLVLREALPGKKIELKLRKANSSQGEATIALNTDAIDLKNRANKIKLDIDWMMGNDDRRSQAKNINFPLTFGLLSHRLCLVRNNDFEFRKISNKNLFLKKIIITQVKSWPDTAILRSNDKLTLKQTQNQKESEKQLLNRQANCFLRGLSEIYIEQKELKESEKKDFSILNTFFFQYHSPINFYVAKDNEYLHDKIDRGLEKILESGQLLCIYKHHYGEFIKRAKLKEDNRIFLGSGKPEKTEHPELYLDFTKDYTNIFKDIEEKQTSQLTPSKCNSLIENLEHENEQLYPNKLKK